jgi:putative tryptophan/tyrosine transport system substrate-binding protein
MGAATPGAVLPSIAQTGGGIRRIGVLANNPPSTPVAAPLWAAFYAGLNERGWVEGRNILIVGRYAAGRTERFAEFAADLVALDVEVIVVLGGTQATQVAKQATSKIPIVFASISNPIESGSSALSRVLAGTSPGCPVNLATLPRKSLSSCYALSSRTSSASV